MRTCCLYVSLFRFLNRWTDFCEIWYEQHATAGHPNHVVVNLTTIGNNGMADARTSEVEVALAPHNSECWCYVQ